MNTPQSQLTRIDADIQWLTSTIGPRPAYSSSARLAALGIRDRLSKSGWEPQFVHIPNNVIACNGSGQIILLAHSDTVPNSPGTLDNAVAVGALLEVARQFPNANLCLGFPAQEELGLNGSRYLAEQIHSWHPDPSAVQLVLSLDLVGHGTLSVTGLNRTWSSQELQQFIEISNVHSEYGYQVVSRLFPDLERSDHASFASIGYRSAQLLGRNEHGITPNYHQSTDLTYEPLAVTSLMNSLENIIITDWSEVRKSTHPAVTFGHIVAPGWSLYPLWIMGIFVTIRSIRANGLRFIPMLKAVGLCSCIGIVASCPAWLGLLPSNTVELEVTNTFGVKSNGWWMGASFFLPMYIFSLVWIYQRQFCKGNSVAWWGLCATIATFVDPVLGLPWVVATLLSTIHPLLSLIGVCYWMQSDILRELIVHGLMLPWMWGLIGLIGFPAVISHQAASRA